MSQRRVKVNLVLQGCCVHLAHCHRSSRPAWGHRGIPEQRLDCSYIRVRVVDFRIYPYDDVLVRTIWSRNPASLACCEGQQGFSMYQVIPVHKSQQQVGIQYYHLLSGHLGSDYLVSKHPTILVRKHRWKFVSQCRPSQPGLFVVGLGDHSLGALGSPSDRHSVPDEDSAPVSLRPSSLSQDPSSELA